MKNGYLCKTPYLASGDPVQKKEEIRNYFLQTYELYERLFETLVNDEVFYKRPEPLRHPIIFYFGHTAVFFVNKLLLGKWLHERINGSFESMFAVGVDEMSWDDLNERHYNWPDVHSVREYREEVKKAVLALVESLPLTLPVEWDSFYWALLMGIEHERIHLETSSVLIRQLDICDVKTHELWPRCQQSGDAPQNELLSVGGGRVNLGRGENNDYYGWDNEYGTKSFEIGSFEASRYLVSNGEFLRFVQNGGYDSTKYWDSEGARWLEYKKAKHPPFWIEKQNGWFYRTMCEELPLPLDWPVDVNYHEARAFCNFLSERIGKKLRLPTEAEWHRLYNQEMGSKEALLDDGKANINLAHFASSCPVTTFAHGDFFDIHGNVWQWSETAIDGFDGFRVHALYDDFSVPTFDGRHNLIKGGSWISTGNETLLSSRYAFRRHFFQHAGFRYVCSQNSVEDGGNIYETDRSVSQYLEFHYGKKRLNVDNFLSTCAKIALGQMAGRSKKKALDIGCAVGRASFELAREFESVTALDFSARFISRGVELANSGCVGYEFCTEGEIYDRRFVCLSDLGLDTFAHKVEFLQADACNLKEIFRGYDLMLALNLIDRLYDPKKFLQDTASRINSGGLLVLSSPYSWSEEYTPKERWLGGFVKDGVAVDSFEAVKGLLEGDFRLLEAQNIPFVLAESERKHQYTFSHLSIWERV